MHIDDLAQASADSGKPPLTANPAFPWIVALWFAALLGVGSLVVPVTLIERVIGITGLPAVLPMTAAPLGFTAQALVALVGTIAGGALGFVLARKVAAPRADRPARASRKVLNPVEDLGDDGIAGEADDDLPAPRITGRRRSLAIAEEEGPSEFLKSAARDAEEQTDEEPLEMSADMEEPAVIPEETVAFAEPAPESAEPRQVFQPVPEPEQEPLAEAPLELEEEEVLTQAQPEPAHIADEEPVPRQEFQAVAAASTPVVDIDFTPPVVAEATAAEPLPFSPPSMAQEAVSESEEQCAMPAEPGPESEDSVSDKQTFDAQDAEAEELSLAAFSCDAPEADAGDEPGEHAADDLGADDLGPDDHAAVAEEPAEGLVQLVQRLGSTIEKHRDWSARQAALRAEAAALAVISDPEPETEPEPVADAEPEARASEPKVPDEFDPAAAEDAAMAMAAYFGAASPAPVEDAPLSEADEATLSPEEDAVDAPDTEVPADIKEQPAPVSRPLFGGADALADLGGDEDDEDEDDDTVASLAASFSLPLAREEDPEPQPIARPAFDQPPHADDESTGEEVSETAEFASLNPFKRNADEFVRIEEPETADDDAEPAVQFPNQANKPAAARAFDPPASPANGAAQRAERPRPSNDDNERALREALMNLQRMGK